MECGRYVRGLFWFLAASIFLWVGVFFQSGFAQTGLSFNSTNQQYVTFGAAPELTTQNFTVEIWFMRTGTGTSASTGAGGVPNMIPLITKGAPQAEGSTVDANYILGVSAGTNVLAADFEEGTGSAIPGLNHPLYGVTPIINNVWYHAAVTFSSGEFRIYLNGNLESQQSLGSNVWPQGANTQHAGLATMITAVPAPVGFFAGVLDEPRIWDHARTRQEIRDNMFLEITSAPGLLGRWGLNEGSGTIAGNSVSGGSNGTLTGVSGVPTWVSGFPFNATTPAAPSGLSATALSYSQIQLTWTDNSNDEVIFEIERSDMGSGGPFFFLASARANTTTFIDKTAYPGTEYCYRIRAVNSGGASGYTTVECATTPTESDYALDFGGTNAYVTFGNNATLGLPQFTLECWFRRDGTGVTTTTGGITAVPLIAKGRGEADGSNVDMNYFLGINTAGVLAADFENNVTGGNHPISGTTAIVLNVWYHVAVTYNGVNTWQLYLNGLLDASLTLPSSFVPQSGSVQHAAIASALNSTGVAAGFFNGAVDEVRIWNYARTYAEIQSTINSELITPQTGLVARWGLNEGAGATVSGIGGTFVTGTVMGANYSWLTGGAPFNIVITPPADPSNASANALSYLEIQLSWNDNSNNETNFEIERSTTGSGGPFALLATVAANSTSYNDQNLDPLQEYCYRVRAVNGVGNSNYTNTTCATTPAEGDYALDFVPNSYVTFGNPPQLGLSEFTIECWFRRDGAGSITTTGSGGITSALPLVTKGRGEADGDNRDMNYFFGIDDNSDVLAADFEDIDGSPVGLNHPVYGVTVINTGVWYHGAATYDGNKWQLFLNGILETELPVGKTPQSASIQHAAIASALTSTGSPGTPAGHFDGVIDEVRIWNYARTQVEIISTINSEITAAQTGLVARWGLNEGSGTIVHGNAGTTANGTIMPLTGGSWSWTTPGAPFDIIVNPPADPSALSANAYSYWQVQLTWNDNSDNETSFEIERSTTGSGGPFTLLASVGANTTTYTDEYLLPETEYCYQVRAVNGAGNSNYTNTACETTPLEPNNALDFGGTDGYVTFGAAPALGVTQFTIECWFRRDGAGATASTGSGGVTAVPLVTKGRGEADGSNIDMNYFLGIDGSGRLAADFEDNATGGNHPITGTTAIANTVWYHAAVTYDGVNTWKLYLNGALDATLILSPNITPQSGSIQHAAIASALNSEGAPEGYFDGVIDEARIWNYPRTQAEIQADINNQLTAPQSGLLARWGLNEGSGTLAHNSAGTIINGTITGSNWSWVSGAPFGNQPPDQPTLIAPPNGGSGIPLSPTLSVAVSDPDNDYMTVTFYGRAVTGPAPGPDFTLIGLPDTQYYTSSKNGGSPAIFNAQTQWIVDNKAALNIVYVAHFGDCVDDGDLFEAPWQAADAAMDLIENPTTTGLPDGIPYAITVGNHDQSPNGVPTGTTTYYNQYFGEARFSGRGYYGGHYGSNNDNHYALFSASGMDFIVIDLEYDTSPDADVITWMENLLQTYSTRRAIIVSHYFIGTGNPGAFSSQGTATYNAVRDNPNVFLMLCGHVPGEGRRTDTFNGNTIHTVMADYQGRTNGGNGWLRIMKFSPANNEIQVQTYSPMIPGYETDGDSEFTLPYDMQGSGAFQVIGTQTNVASGGTASIVWPALSPLTNYEWYATVSDGNATITGPTWSFTTANDPPQYLLSVTTRGAGSVAKSPDLPAYTAGTNVQLTALPASWWKFKKWSGDLSGSTNPENITVTGTTNVQAIFENTVNHALTFDGGNDYVTFGVASGLNTPTFTLECWLKKTGPGATGTTGTGGIIHGIPLIAKGTSEAEQTTLDINYYLGIDTDNGTVIAADFEEGAGGSSPGLNHPVHGVTTIVDGIWYHAAATYDGTTWRLYLNGVLEATLAVGQPPALPATSLTTFATALETNGTTHDGFFEGVMDEIHIWNLARSETQIRQTMCQKLAGNEAGLLGYWRLDEASGMSVLDLTDNLIDGTITGSAPLASYVYSGAALGDESVYDYTAAGGYSASISHTNGDNLSATTTAGTISGVQVYRADADALRTGATLPPELAVISPLRYWGVFVVGSGSPQYTVTYNYAGHPGIVDENDLALAVRDDHSDNSWADVVADLNTAANTLIKTGQGGTEYALASVTPDNSLPVELSAFTAAPGDERISLKWTTESEINNLGFILERALAEEGPFAEIASYQYVPELQGQGNSSQRVEYAYVDEGLENGTAYYYRLSDVDVNGNRSYHGTIVNATPHVVIMEFRLHANYPNPFNPGTNIKFDVPEDTPGHKKVQLIVYNSLGQEVRKLFDGSIEGGAHEVYWDARDDRGNPAATGIYFVRLKANQYVKTVKMTLMR